MPKGASKHRKDGKKQPTQLNRREERPTTAPVAASTHPQAVPDGIFIAGLVPLLAAVALTAVLVANHLGGLSLPGCRPGGACDQAAASAWGKIPGTTWPISFVGLAYFAGLFCAWLASKGGGVSPQLKNLVRLGVLLSVMYLIVLLVERHACYYCIGTHVANILFWLLIESLRPTPAAAWKPVLTTSVVFLLASAALGATEWRGKKAEEARQETQLADSTREIIESIKKPAEPEPSDATSVTPEKPAGGATTQTHQDASTVDAQDRPWQGGFTGRYRWGPEEAAIRIVMITDYQCPDCRRSENDVINLMNARTDVSVSIKHFPFCTDCNPGVGKTLHPNACWAARAAETAGILRGADGFWPFHKALFEMGGGFTNEEFDQLLQRFDYNRKEFVDIMQSAVTLDLVKKDIQEALWLGLHYTPMIFINGRELKGVFAHQAISRAIAEISVANPPLATCANDQPPPAAQKYVNDWRENEPKLPGVDAISWPMGAERARLHIVMWGDYEEPNTAKADAAIREFIKGRTDAQYLFRHYPVNQTCNQKSQLTKHPNACRMAQAAEAAGLLYGTDGFWKVHDWLMKNQQNYNDRSLRDAVLQMGLLPDALLVKMDSPETAEGIVHDCEAGKSMGLSAVPCIFVNQRFVPRWHRAGDNILERIFEAALEESAPRNN